MLLLIVRLGFMNLAVVELERDERLDKTTLSWEYLALVALRLAA